MLPTSCVHMFLHLNWFIAIISACLVLHYQGLFSRVDIFNLPSSASAKARLNLIGASHSSVPGCILSILIIAILFHSAYILYLSVCFTNLLSCLTFFLSCQEAWLEMPLVQLLVHSTSQLVHVNIVFTGQARFTQMQLN